MLETVIIGSLFLAALVSYQSLAIRFVVGFYSILNKFKK